MALRRKLTEGISLALEGYKHRKLEHNPGKEFRNQS